MFLRNHISAVVSHFPPALSKVPISSDTAAQNHVAPDTFFVPENKRADKLVKEDTGFNNQVLQLCITKILITQKFTIFNKRMTIRKWTGLEYRLSMTHDMMIGTHKE